MSLCPKCQQDLSQDDLDRGVCPECGEGLPTDQPPQSDETQYIGTVLPEQLAKPRNPAPQLEKHVKKKLAATYDMEDWSSNHTIKLAGGARKPTDTDPPSSEQDHDTRDTSRPTVVQSGKWVRPNQDIQENAEISFQSTYQLLTEVGRGGMGRVWKARQKSLQRDVALKIPYPADETLDEGSKLKKQERIEKQFVSEVLVTAKLDHPNIVPVHDMGQDEKGNRVFAMKLLTGKSWDHHIKSLSEDENLEILLKACDAIAFAHAQTVVHLDIKPENIWVGDFGEVSVVDWGVAVRFKPPEAEDWAPDETEWNVAVDGLPGLTPAYAAPEMIDSVSRGVIGPTTDVYLLGAVLYEIITGKPPHEFTGRPMTDATKAWRNEIVPTDKTGDLVNIAYRAMATEPKHRYPNVKALQDALRDYQSHRESRVLAANAKESLEEAEDYEGYQAAIAGFDNAISLWSENDEAKQGAKDARLAYAQAAKSNQDFDLGLSVLDEEDEDHSVLCKELASAKRARDAQAKTLARARWTARAVIAASILGLIYFSYSISRKNVQNRELAMLAKQEAARATQNEQEARRNADEAERNALEAKEQEMLAKANEDLARENERLANDNALKAQEQATENAELAQRNKQIADDARRSELQALAATRRVLEVSYRSTLGLAGETLQRNAFDVAKQMLSDIEEEKIQRKLRHWEWGHLVATTQNPVVRDFLSGKGKRLARVEAVDRSPTGDVVVAGTEDGNLFVWKLSSGEIKTSSFAHGEAIYAVAVSSDGKLVATGGVDDESEFAIKIWRLTDGNVFKLDGHQGPVISVAFSKNATQLLSSAADGTARLWNLDDPQVKSRSFRGHLEKNVRSARFSPDEKWIVTTGDDGFVHLWAADEGFLVKRFVGHEGPVFDATFTSDGSGIVSGGDDRRLLLWQDLPQPDEVTDFLKKYVADVERKVTQNERSQIPTTREFKIIGRHDAAVRSVSTAASKVFSASHDNTVRVWDLEGDEAPKTLRGHGGWVRACRADPTGKYVLSGGYDGRVRLWDWERQYLPHVLAAVADGNRPTDRHLQSLAYSPDGKWIAMGSRRGQLMVWSMADGAQVVGQELRQGHDWLATSGTYFQDGQRLLTTGGDNRAIIWDTRRGTQLQQLGRSWNQPGGIGWYGVAAVSANGKYVVTGSDQADTPVRIWDSQSGELAWDNDLARQIRSFMTSTKAITAAAFSQDSEAAFVLVGGDDGAAYLIRRANGELIHRLAGHAKQVNAAAFSRDGQHAFTASSDGTVITWSTQSGEKIGSKQHDGAVTALSLSADGRRMLTASRVTSQVASDAAGQPLVCLWDPFVDEQPLRKLPLSSVISGHRQSILSAEELGATVRSAQLDADGQRALITTFVSFEKSASRYFVGDWDLAEQYEPFQQFANISSATYSRGNQEVLVVGSKGARLLTRQASQVVRRYEQPTSIQSLAFSRDSRRLAIGSRDGAVVIWKLNGDQWRPEFNDQPEAHEDGVMGVEFHSQMDDVLVTAGRDGSLKVWRIDDQAADLNLLLEERGAHQSSINGISMAVTSPHLLSVSDDGSAKLWEISADECRLVRTLQQEGATEPIRCGTLSSDGKWAVTASGFVATIWDTSTGQSLGDLRGHSARINSVVFSHDARRVLTSSGDFTARVWDTRPLAEMTDSIEGLAFDEMLPLEEHSGEVNSAVFSPNGQLAVSIGSDGQAIVWPSVKIEPSINIPRAETDYVVGSGSQQAVAFDAQLVHPTLADFCSATLTIEILGGPQGLVNERLAIDVPDGFEVIESTPSKVVVVRRPTEADQGILGCVNAHDQWQRLMRSLTYTVDAVGVASPDTRQIYLQMDGIRFGKSDPADGQGLLDATATIQVRLDVPQRQSEGSITAPVSRR